jgi:hypothetical protein
MGGKLHPDSTQITIILPKTLKAEIEQLATRELSTLSVVVRRSLLREIARATEEAKHG